MRTSFRVNTSHATTTTTTTVSCGYDRKPIYTVVVGANRTFNNNIIVIIMFDININNIILNSVNNIVLPTF